MSTASHGAMPAIPGPRSSSLASAPVARGATVSADVRSGVDGGGFARQLHRVESANETRTRPGTATDVPDEAGPRDAVDTGDATDAAGTRETDGESRPVGAAGGDRSPDGEIQDGKPSRGGEARSVPASTDVDGAPTRSLVDASVPSVAEGVPPGPVSGASTDGVPPTDTASSEVVARSVAAVEDASVDPVPPEDAIAGAVTGPDAIVPDAVANEVSNGFPEEVPDEVPEGGPGGTGRPSTDAGTIDTGRTAAATAPESLADRVRADDVSDEGVVPANVRTRGAEPRDVVERPVVAPPVVPAPHRGTRPSDVEAGGTASIDPDARPDTSRVALGISRDGYPPEALRTVSPPPAAANAATATTGAGAMPATAAAADMSIADGITGMTDAAELAPPTDEVAPDRRVGRTAPELVPGRIPPSPTVTPGAVETGASGAPNTPGAPLPIPLALVTGTPFATRLEVASPSASIAPQSVPLDGASGAAEELAAGVRWTAGEGRGQAWINVTPAGLGPVAIRVAIEGDQVSVSIAASQAGAREALEPLIPRLREQLAADGHRNVDVDLSGGRDDSRRQAEGGDGRTPAGADGRSGTGRAGNDVEEDAATSLAHGSRNGAGAMPTGIAAGRALVDSWA